MAARCGALDGRSLACNRSPARICLPSHSVAYAHFDKGEAQIVWMARAGRLRCGIPRFAARLESVGRALRIEVFRAICGSGSIFA